MSRIAFSLATGSLSAENSGVGHAASVCPGRVVVMSGKFDEGVGEAKPLDALLATAVALDTPYGPV